MRKVIEVSLEAAQADFERLMAATLRGDKVVITRDGVAVAELVPPQG